MTLFDWIVIAILVLSMIVAAAQGFLREVISFFGLILGLWLALWNYHVVATHVARVIHSEHVADALAFLLIALGVMIIVGLLGRLISRLARVAGLGGLDSLLGAVFGILRGYVLIVIAIVAMAAFIPQNTWMNGSRFAPYFLPAAEKVSAGAPAELRLKIRDGIAVMKHIQPTWIQLHLHPDPSTR